MLRKLDKKVRQFVTNQSGEPEISPEISDNPLVSYLRVFQNQHKVISVLYRGLIIAFLGFVLLLSLLIINVLSNELVPLWGIVSLAAIDLFLIFGIVKAFTELSRYGRKSTDISRKTYEYLRDDLFRLQKMKTKNIAVGSSSSQLSTRIKAISQEPTRQRQKEYAGWDRRICPRCHAAIEMLQEECPFCSCPLEKTFSN